MNADLPRLCEYGQIKANNWPMSQHTELASFYHPQWRTRVRLIHATHGYECAGSMARLTQEKWGASYFLNATNATHGQWFCTETEAREHFEKIRARLNASA